MASFGSMMGSSLTLKSEWISGSERNIPENRSRAAGGMTGDGKFFVLTGGLDRYKETNSSVWVFDVKKGVWNTNFPKMKTGRSSHGCIIVGSKVYIFGGRSWINQPLQSVEVLDLNQPESGWVNLQPMSIARAPIAVERLGKKVYIFGSLSPPSASNPNGSNIDDSIECFDLQRDRWEKRGISRIPNRGICLGSTVFENKICLIGAGNTAPMIFDGSAWKHYSAVPYLKIDQRRDGSANVLGVVHYRNEADEEDEDDDEEEDQNENEQQQNEADVNRNDLTQAGRQFAASSTGGTGKGIAVLIGVVLVAAAIIGGGAVLLNDPNSFLNSSSTSDDDKTGQINVRLNTDEFENHFCLELSPKPTISIEVVCVSDSDHIPCCEGNNIWRFDQTTEVKCGALIVNSSPDKPSSSVVITCSANGYSNGTLVINTSTSSPANTVATSEPSFSPSVSSIVPTTPSTTSPSEISSFTPSLSPSKTSFAPSVSSNTPSIPRSEKPSFIPSKAPIVPTTPSASPSESPFPSETKKEPSGRINVFRYEGDLFCFDLIPKPVDNTIVTCESSSQYLDCCQGEEEGFNQWLFRPDSAFMCGSLIEIYPEETPISSIAESSLSPHTNITCQAKGYSNGTMEYLVPTAAPISSAPVIQPIQLCSGNVPINARVGSRSNASGSFLDYSEEQALANAVDCYDLEPTEIEQNYVYWIPGPVEIVFEYKMVYRLEKAYFWSYFEESFDVDRIDLEFFDLEGGIVGSQTIFPNLAVNATGAYAHVVVAEIIELDPPVEAASVSAIFSADDGVIDFYNFIFAGYPIPF